MQAYARANTRSPERSRLVHNQRVTKISAHLNGMVVLMGFIIKEMTPAEI